MVGGGSKEDDNEDSSKIYGLETILAGATITKHHKLGGLNTRNVFLRVLKAGKSKIKMSSGLQMATFSICPHMGK